MNLAPKGGYTNAQFEVEVFVFIFYFLLVFVESTTKVRLLFYIVESRDKNELYRLKVYKSHFLMSER